MAANLQENPPVGAVADANVDAMLGGGGASVCSWVTTMLKEVQDEGRATPVLVGVEVTVFVADGVLEMEAVGAESG